MDRCAVAIVCSLPLEFREDFTFSNVTNDRAPLAGALGFRKNDLSRGLDLIPRLSVEQRRGALDLMCRHLTGYRFTGGEEAVYNPAQSLFLLDHLSTGLRDIDKLMALDVARDHTLHEKLADRSVLPSSGFNELIFSVPRGQRTIIKHMNTSASERIHVDRRVSADELHRSLERDGGVQSLLYHLGFATYADASGKMLTVPPIARRVLTDSVFGGKLNQSQTSN
jgi:hypothetical protein